MMRVDCSIVDSKRFIRYTHDKGIEIRNVSLNVQGNMYSDVLMFCDNNVYDLINIALFVYTADKSLNREWFYDQWHRRITLSIGVHDLDKMNSIKSHLSKTLGFLSGDIWEFDFYKVEAPRLSTSKHIFNEMEMPEVISLFSGGLDSFIGAIDLLHERKNVYFFGVTHRGKSTGRPQRKLFEYLVNKYGIESEKYVSVCIETNKSNESSTRTRSFLYISLAVGLASIYKVRKVLIPENGFVSLNIPLTESRLGSGSTKSTHPYFIKAYKEILISFGIDVEIELPYLFKTKGQMIDECKDQLFLSQTIEDTISCANANSQRVKGISHCGVCWPCIVRRSAINSSRMEENTRYSKLEFPKEYQFFLKDTSCISPEFKIMESGSIDVCFVNEHVKVFELGIAGLISLRKKSV